MWWWVEIVFVGRCSAHGGDGKKACTVFFGGGQDNSGKQLEIDRISGK